MQLLQNSLLKFFLLLLLNPLIVRAQSIDWAVSAGSFSTDKGSTVVSDEEGYVYINGNYYATTDFDPGTDTYDLTAVAIDDVFVLKLDANGEFVWAKSVGGLGTDNGNSIALDDMGNIYVTGHYMLTVDFDPGPGVYNLTGTDNTDVFILKLDNDGEFVWAKSIDGSTRRDEGESIVVDENQNVFVTGFIGETADFDPGVGTYNIDKKGKADIFVLHLSSNGDFIWAKSMGWDGAGIYGMDISLDFESNIILTGRFDGTVDFDPNINEAFLTSNGGDDMFIVKLTYAGGYMWSTNVGSAGHDHAFFHDSDVEGNIYISGKFEGLVDFNPGLGTNIISSNGSYDLCVFKFNGDGEFVWVRAAGGGANDFAQSVVVGNKGDVFVTGTFQESMSFDINGVSKELICTGQYDIFFLKISSSGDIIKAERAGGEGSGNWNFGMGISANALGDVHATGFFYGTADFDSGEATVNLTSNGQSDAFVLKFGQEWILGSNSDVLNFAIADYTESVSIDANNHIVNLEVTNGTGLTTLSPAITLPDGASVSPESGVAQDFTESVVYTVTAEDGITTQQWTVNVSEVTSTATDILTFGLTEQTGDASIDLDSHTVSIYVAIDTDLTALSPTISLSEGATISPESGLVQDFTESVAYTVTAEDGVTIQQWTVNVSEVTSAATDILTFSLTEQTGDAIINLDSHTISIYVAIDTDLTALSPTISMSEGASILPESGSVQDFTESVIYTVTAEDGITTQQWSVNVLETPSTETDVLTFVISGQIRDAIIDLENHTIASEVLNEENLSSLLPTITFSEGATVSPESGVVQDFTVPVTYTVTAEDGIETQEWMVTVQQRAIPEITNFSPVRGPVGTAVTIYGAGFDPDIEKNAVFFGPVEAVVISVNSTEMEVVVPVGATYEPIIILVEGLQAYSSNPFLVSFEEATLSYYSFVEEEYFHEKWDEFDPVSLVTGDIDRDGKPDIVVVNTEHSNFSIFENSSSGMGNIAFETRIDFSSGSSPVEVAIGDLNGNGNLDLAVVDRDGAKVYVFQNTSTGAGDISYADPIEYVTGVEPQAVSISDLDNDGRLDLVVANSGSNSLSIFRNISIGNDIVYADKMDYDTGSNPWDVALGDVDGDGKKDMIIVNRDDHNISVFGNNSTIGTMDFANSLEFHAGTNPIAVEVADVDNDDRLDLLITNSGSNLAVLKNTSTSISDISYAYKLDFTTYTISKDLTISDLNSDGLVDVVVPSSGFKYIQVFENASNLVDGISFSENYGAGAGTGPNEVSMCDMDGDGRDDMIIINEISNSMSVHRRASPSSGIISFTLEEETKPATFDPVNHTIVMEVVNGTYINALTPTIMASLGATISPKSGVEQDFTEPVIYTVTAEDGSTTQEWTVSVEETSDVVTWDGSVWSNTIGPEYGVDVIINGDLDFGFTCSNITVSEGSIIDIGSDETMTIYGDMENYGSVVIQSGGSLYTVGDYEHTGSPITFYRNTRYEDGKYSFVGSPVKYDSDITGDDLGRHVYLYDESASSNIDDLNRWIGVQTNVLIPGRGYTQAEQKVIEFIGYPNSGTVNYAGSYVNDGWHLISNPYPVSISLSSFLEENEDLFTGAVYIWDDNSSNIERGSNDDYIIANEIGAIDNSGPENESRWGGYIGAMQGFFIQLSGTDAIISFTDNMKSQDGNNSDDNFFRNTSKKNPLVRVNLTHEGGLFKQTILGWDEMVSDREITFGYDAPVFNIEADYSIYTIKEEEALAIQTVTHEKANVFLGYSVLEEGTYTIKVDKSEAENESLFIKDNQTNTLINIEQGSYTFISQVGRFDNRFELIFRNSNDVINNDFYVISKDKSLIIANDSELSDFKILNLLGQVIWSGEVIESREIDLNSNPIGVYVIMNGRYSTRVILK